MCDRCTALTTLELTPGAPPTEIKDAYRLLATVWHPDRFQTDADLRLKAEEKLKEINVAYQLLTADDIQARPSASDSQPEQSQQGTRAGSSPTTYPSPNTSHFNRPFREERRGSRLGLVVAAAILVAGVAWIILRNMPAVLEFTRSTGTNTSAPHEITRPAFDNSKPTDGSPAAAGTVATGAIGTSDSAQGRGETSAHSRSNAVRAEGASLLVYPADDPRVAYFTIGSTRTDVLRVQGTPNRAAGNTFEYGLSEVYFQNGRVQSWRSDPRSPLRARMPE